MLPKNNLNLSNGLKTAYLHTILLRSKITKILNSDENSKQRVPYQMVKSNDKTTRNEWITTLIFLTRYWHFQILKMVD